ncbi:MAG: hypothetical protein ACOYBY_01460 [Dermatophilaceae bacterium]
MSEAARSTHPDAPEPVEEDDLRLLRAFEPVVRFTRGEYFFPVAVQGYVARATLWQDTEDADSVRVAAAGSLDLTALSARTGSTQGLGESLSGIVTGEPESPVVVPTRDRPPRLTGGSRLAAVGLLARLVDALNRLSLVFRGSVPGGSAARSYLLQRDHLAADRPAYHARVVRDGYWIVLQYWFFYSFNNWRSAFGGVNEHEADWEQVTVYLDGTGALDRDGLPAPRWVVFSAHDETGDDLRRRWDDPDLQLVESRHPVVFAGAGSHSGAYLPGDYLITIPAPTLGGVIRFFRWLGRVITPGSHAGGQPSLSIPYVDYARGDGRVCGPGGDPWAAVVIDDDTEWVRDFRGLWGHDTRDRLGGERGPAGPRYERDGTVRTSWADPVGWAGLAKIAPNQAVEADLVRARIGELDERLVDLEADRANGRHTLAAAAAGMAPSSPEVRSLAGEERKLLRLGMEATALRDERARMVRALHGPTTPVHPHAHLRTRRTPLQPVSGARARVLSGWAVISSPVLLFAAGVVCLPNFGVSSSVAAASWIVLLLCVEGLLRATLVSTLARMAVAALLLFGLYHLVIDWRVVLAALFYAAALLLLVVNLRDAWRR